MSYNTHARAYVRTRASDSRINVTYD